MKEEKLLSELFLLDPPPTAAKASEVLVPRLEVLDRTVPPKARRTEMFHW